MLTGQRASFDSRRLSFPGRVNLWPIQMEIFTRTTSSRCNHYGRTHGGLLGYATARHFSELYKKNRECSCRLKKKKKKMVHRDSRPTTATR